MERHTMEYQDLPCPMCGNTAFDRTTTKFSMENPTVVEYVITTKCRCGLEFTTHHKSENEDIQFKVDAVAEHIKKWNTRPIEKDLIDIKVYAENIITRCNKYNRWKIQ